MLSPAARADTTQTDTPQADEVVLTWTVHLLGRRPAALGPLVACLAAVVIVGLCVFHNLLLALLPAAALLLSLSEFVFPITYVLSRERVSMRYGPTLLEMPWRDVRHAYVTETGIKLSPLRARGSRFEPLRGIFVHFAGTDGDVVTETVRRLREEARAK